MEAQRIAPTSEFRRGWTLVLVSILGVVCSPSVLPVYSLGVFIAPLEAEFGWSRSQIATAILFSTGLGALSAPIVGFLIDRIGVRPVAIFGLIGLALGFIFAATISGALWQFYTAYILMGLLGAGATPVAWSTLITKAFEQKRGLALGLALSGTGLCAFVVPQYASVLVEIFGWRLTYLGLACIPLLIALPLAYGIIPPHQKPVRRTLLRERASKSEQSSIIVSLVRTYRFWVIVISLMTIYISISGIIPNLIPAMMDRGISSQAAATVVSIFGISIILGRIFLGWLLDRFWAPMVALIVFAACVFACTIFMSDNTYTAYLAASSIIGAATGMQMVVLPYVTAKYFGLLNYSKIYSLFYAVVAISAGAGPMAFSSLYDLTGDYELPFLCAAVLFAIGGLILLTLGPYTKSADALLTSSGSKESQQLSRWRQGENGSADLDVSASK